jgi:NADH dehydrogenase/NADH:ubiquinone oxidoreductase subunit G
MSEQTCETSPTTPVESDLLDPYERLVTIEVLGQRVEVPEKNRLLRCFQYLSLETISYGDFCWNGDCTNCQVWYHTEGQTPADDKPALSCRLPVTSGMVITRMNPLIVVKGINK